MKQILRFWLLNRITKNPQLSAEIYQMIYHNRVFTRNDYAISKINETSSVQSIATNSVSNRKKEMISALNELKSKSIKTKQDKESISIIEAALKNGYE